MKISMAAARVNAGLTQGEVAKKMNVSTNTVLDWEKGRRRPRTNELAKYCEICGCTPNDISFA